MFEERIASLEPIFHPRSIAVVGVSADDEKLGNRWVRALVTAGFAGHIYPIGARAGRTSGLTAYPSLRLVPGEVDYVIVAIPRHSVLDLLDDCAAKGVKAVQFFTAGFSEMGGSEGKWLEEEMLEKARRGGFRIIGPNCVGVYCPESGIPYGPTGEAAPSKTGSVGFVSQSGGIAGKLIAIGASRHIDFSKGVSFGNGIDLDASDFLQYLAADPKTSVIGAYLEGTRDGRRLFETMRAVAGIKPLVVWKGGRTKAGAQAAMSHTGSLASPAVAWSGLLRQVGAMEVPSLEEFSDALLFFQQVQHWRGSRAVVVAGLAEAGGGISVSGGDACVENGLEVPPLSSHTRQRLADLIGELGSILCNPVDLSGARFHGLTTVFEAIDLLAKDTAIDIVLIQEDVELLLAGYSWEQLVEINQFFINLASRHEKPTVVILPPGSAESERRAVEEQLLLGSVPVFPDTERAARAIHRADQYFRGHVPSSAGDSS